MYENWNKLWDNNNITTEIIKFQKSSQKKHSWIFLMNLIKMWKETKDWQMNIIIPLYKNGTVNNVVMEIAKRAREHCRKTMFLNFERWIRKLCRKVYRGDAVWFQERKGHIRLITYYKAGKKAVKTGKNIFLCFMDVE